MTNINALKVEKIDDVLLHERDQLGLYELFIDVNKPSKSMKHLLEDQ